ncbi:restriction endonuclease subunit S [Crocosphaera sp. XPORK-15E]|uniref:restriction endonuclease subunit S n=1 Tax=Crocosphaera sp. XPORK-15E TaxID=3110247 RepID=UPI002B21C788|nr:restriction endonuclease subunit S [Crocosphaera sp. XPORK-15E]MEA5533711.1 restriction endonuclease subunit S [Crocosphaera sp. XPORK-15E]
MEEQRVKKGYKLTDIGVIPDDWDVKKLGEIANIVMGQSPLGSSYNHKYKGIPLLNGPTEFTKRYPIKIQWTTSPTKVCEKGDILLCIRGSSTGRINISNDRYCIGRGITAIRAKETLNNTFLEFQIYDAVNRILTLSSGSTFPNIDSKSLKKIQITFPPLPEQQKIAEVLSDVDKGIAALEKLLTKKRNIKQGTMQLLLTGKKRLPGFTGEWEVKKLGDVGKFKNGINKGKEDFGFGYPFVNLLDVFGQTRLSNKISLGLINSTQVERKDYDLKKGDILFIRSSVKPEGVGLTSLVIEDLYNSVYSGFLIRFRDFNLLNLDYKEYCFYEESFRKKLIDNSTVSANTNINQDALKKLEISLPPTTEEQKAIANILSDMDKEIEKIEKQRDKYKQIKQGMMQELLTGKTRLV